MQTHAQWVPSRSVRISRAGASRIPAIKNGERSIGVALTIFGGHPAGLRIIKHQFLPRRIWMTDEFEHYSQAAWWRNEPRMVIKLL
jgi:hypothetical protein